MKILEPAVLAAACSAANLYAFVLHTERRTTAGAGFSSGRQRSIELVHYTMKRFVEATSICFAAIARQQGCARGLFSRDRGETDTLKPETETEALTIIQAEARPRPRPSELETETRPRRTNSEARLSHETTAPGDGLETEASRPRPHPASTPFRRLM